MRETRISSDVFTVSSNTEEGCIHREICSNRAIIWTGTWKFSQFSKKRLINDFWLNYFHRLMKVYKQWTRLLSFHNFFYLLNFIWEYFLDRKIEKLKSGILFQKLLKMIFSICFALILKIIKDVQKFLNLFSVFWIFSMIQFLSVKCYIVFKYQTISIVIIN